MVTGCMSDGGQRRLLVVAGGAAEPLAETLCETNEVRPDGRTLTEIEILVPPDAPSRAVETALEAAEIPPEVAVTTTRAAVTDTEIRRRAETADGVLFASDADEPRFLTGSSNVTDSSNATNSPDATDSSNVTEPSNTTVPPNATDPSNATDPPRSLVHESGAARFLGTFLLSFAFYLLLGNPFDPFDLATGTVTAGVVAAALSSTLFEDEPTVRRTLPRIARSVLFLPYLFYEIGRANLAIAVVILRPSLPIDPELVTVRPASRTEFERAVLANAITLTPGTVTVDVRSRADAREGEDARSQADAREGADARSRADAREGEDARNRESVRDREFVVHALTPGTRDALEAGALDRAVGFVFHGRER
jgi:multisubunit Na+/H+ antiporter MnhE subunit